MTAEDFLQDSLTISHFYNDKYDKMCCFSSDVQKAMKEYARLKCEELLKIVAEKAEVKVEKKSQYEKNRKWEKVKEDEEFDLFDYEMRTSVNKDSILNAIDLNEFIK